MLISINLQRKQRQVVKNVLKDYFLLDLDSSPDLAPSLHFVTKITQKVEILIDNVNQP